MIFFKGKDRAGKKRKQGVRANDRNADFVSQTLPVVIGGSGRSGTTLMRVMLDTHPNLCSGPETWLFTPQGVEVRKLAENFDLSVNRVEDFFLNARSRGEFIDMFFSEYGHLCSKPRWAEKTPANIENIDFIFKTFPNARFIEMVRDGRDVVCSLRTHPKHKVVDGRLVPLNTWNPLDQCINRWLKAIEFSRSYWNHPQYMRVKYEDLVIKTEATLHDVCGFIDEPFEPVMLQYHKVQSNSRDVTRFPQNREATRQINEKSLGRWTIDFSQEDKRLFKEMAGGVLEELGYETNSNW